MTHMNKRVATLNVPAIWTPIPLIKEDINVRKYKSFPYEESGQIKYASSDRPILRYAQNFKKGKLKFSLCLFTDEQSKSNVSKYLKKVANNLTQSDISMALVNSSSTKFMYIEKELYRGDQ